ncbi:MAG: sodium-translocating pyrophosphatase [Pleomorphochaeta sp.]
MIYILAVSVFLALILALYNFKLIDKENPGTEQMIRISSFIKEGAKTFLNQEFKIIILVSIVIFIVLSLIVSFSAAICFLLGATLSSSAAWIGMQIATITNVRVTNKARITKEKGKTLKVAFLGGSVMGLCVAAFALLGLLIVYLVFGKLFNQLEIDNLTFHTNFIGIRDIPFTMSVSSYALGCSLIAMFNRVGGGIYTKAADMGADLVGKAEYTIPEDDPRNPATIADNVGDNVGDVAGLGSDLLESYVGSIISSIVLAIYTSYSLRNTDLEISYSILNELILYPLIFCSLGLLASTISIFIFSKKKNFKNPHKDLNKVTYLSAILTIISTLFLSLFYIDPNIKTFNYGSLSPWYSAVLGIVSGLIIGFFAEYYTSYDFKPTLRVSKASKEGGAIVITKGLAVGMRSTFFPVLVISFCIILSYSCAGLYGVGMSAIGMLSFVAVTVSVDTYGPIADNAGGISQMCKLDEEIRDITDELDAIGNTTAAIGKGFAIGSAALAALSLFASYLHAQLGENNAHQALIMNLIDTYVLSGAIVGAALPYLFSGILIDSVGKSAQKMVDAVREQFTNNPLILEGKATPNYKECISISSKGALSEMKKPALLSVLTPLISGFIFGPKFVGGILIGTTLSAIMLAIFTANSGGAWDNAKKFIEKGNFGGNSSDAHKASIIGDTVGDPLKDTVGPSLDILIKIMSVISVITVSIFSEYNLINLL